MAPHRELLLKFILFTLLSQSINAASPSASGASGGDGHSISRSGSISSQASLSSEEIFHMSPPQDSPLATAASSSAHPMSQSSGATAPEARGLSRHLSSDGLSSTSEPVEVPQSSGSKTQGRGARVGEGGLRLLSYGSKSRSQNALSPVVSSPSDGSPGTLVDGGMFGKMDKDEAVKFQSPLHSPRSPAGSERRPLTSPFAVGPPSPERSNTSSGSQHSGKPSSTLPNELHSAPRLSASLIQDRSQEAFLARRRAATLRPSSSSISSPRNSAAKPHGLLSNQLGQSSTTTSAPAEMSHQHRPLTSSASSSSNSPKPILKNRPSLLSLALGKQPNSDGASASSSGTSLPGASVAQAIPRPPKKSTSMGGLSRASAEVAELAKAAKAHGMGKSLPGR